MVCVWVFDLRTILGQDISLGDYASEQVTHASDGSIAGF